MTRLVDVVGVRHLLWPLAAVVIGGSVLMMGDNPYTTAGGFGASWRWGAALASGSLIAAAVVAAGGGRRGGAAAAGAATGLLWFVPEWAGWAAGPAWARTFASAASALLPAAAMATVAVAYGLGHRVRNVLVGVALAGAALVAMARLVLVDPFRDPFCWRDCEPNPLLLSDAGWLGGATEWLGWGTLVAATVVAAAALVGRWWRSGGGALGGLATLGGVVLLAGLAAPGAMDVIDVEDPVTGTKWSMVAASAGAVVVAAWVCVARLREWRLRVELTRLVEDLRAGPAPGSLAKAMADTLHDPGLRMLYWSAARHGYVDSEGRAASVPAPGEHKVISVARRGEPVAALICDAAPDDVAVERALGPAVLLSLENEQLRAATLAELAELRASRVRIVERSDGERLRLERNLHDGAQQRVVGTALLIRMISAKVGDDPRAAALVTRAEHLLDATLDDLRQIAQGIYPRVLVDEGMKAALFDLADSSPDVSVHIDAALAGRYRRTVETAAYLLVAETVADARRRAATQVNVSIGDSDGTLVVEVTHDGSHAAQTREASDLDDRIAAIEGRVAVTPGEPAGSRVILEVPCAR